MLLKNLDPFKNLDVRRAKISLNDREGDRVHGAGRHYIDFWSPGGDVGFAYWSHYGNGQRNFTFEGQLCLGFIKDEDGEFLLVTVGRVTKLTPAGSPCEHEELPEFRKHIGKLRVRILPDPTPARQRGRYVFNLKRFWDESEVVI